MRTNTATIAVLLTLALSRDASAFAVTDIAAIVKTAALTAQQRLTLDKHGSVYRWLRRMGRRLAIFRPLSRYVASNPPRYRTYNGGEVLPETQTVIDAFNQGVGARRDALVPPLTMDPEGGDLPPYAETELGLLEARDGSILAAFDATGRIRNGRRQERRSLTALEEDVVRIDGSLGSRFDVLSMAAALRLKAKSDRIQLATAAAELALVDVITDRQLEAQAAALRVAMLAPPQRSTGISDALRSERGAR